MTTSQKLTVPYRPRPAATPDELRERRKADAKLRGFVVMNMFLADGETRVKDATGAQLRKEEWVQQLLAKCGSP